MLSFLTRLVGLVLFAIGIVSLIADGIRSIASGSIFMTSLRQTWQSIDAGSLEAAGHWLALRSPSAADLVFGPLLDAPTLIVTGVLGMVLMLLGRRHAPRRRRLLF